MNIKRRIFLGFLLVTLLILQSSHNQGAVKIKKVYESDNLIISQITNHVYEHVSYLNTVNFGKVPCNGMIAIDENEAIVFDTPTDNETSVELINWLTQKMNLKIKAIIPTHFHVDNLGGLTAFHERDIPSFAYFLTINFAKENAYTLPQKSFNNKLELTVGKQKIYAEFVGEGHTKDNIIGYFPKDKVLFGGCLIKEIGANKGNLEDANVNDWATTVETLKLKYPDAKIVIPGHGKLGNIELLDYTINLFK